MKDIDLSEFIYDLHYRKYLPGQEARREGVATDFGHIIACTVAETIQNHVLTKWREEWDSLEDVPHDVWAEAGIEKCDDGRLLLPTKRGEPCSTT